MAGLVKSRKVKQIGGTGIWLAASASVVSGLGLYLKDARPRTSSSILDYGTPVWMAIPALLAGIVGILAARRRTKAWAGCFLACCILAFCVGAASSILMGIQMTSDRSKGECKNVRCPYDLDAILMLLLIGLTVLQTVLALTGIIDGSIVLSKDHTEVLEPLQISNSVKKREWETDQKYITVDTAL